jgi:hypothetical protein
MLTVLREHPVYARLPEYDFNAADRLMEFHAKLVHLVDTDEAQKAAFRAGRSNLAIARTYKESMAATIEAAFKAKDKTDDEMAAFLTIMYIGELQQLVATMAALDKDPSKNSNLYKVLEASEGQLAALKEIDIDINPDQSLKTLITDSMPRLSGKPNITGVLENIDVLL